MGFCHSYPFVTFVVLTVDRIVMRDEGPLRPQRQDSWTSSQPSHVKNSIPYSQFLRLRRLCSDDSDLSFAHGIILLLNRAGGLHCCTVKSNN